MEGPLSSPSNAPTALQKILSGIESVGGSLVDKTLALSPTQIIDVVGMIAGAFLPGAQLAGFTISQLTGLAAGVAGEIPSAIDAYNEIKAVAASGVAPTAAQWAKWNAAADLAHAAAQEAADRVINGSGP